ncbi:hypothetical protein [Agaribacterium sp. ZY112]|uniref:hypothetical protein n=1 Tax=Agaribacterium sp. ZY112 TaxID=3233574 RepID=UPI003524E37D
MSQLKYLTDDINELDAAEHDLENNGIPRNNIHILSNDQHALSEHDLPPFSEWARRDILYYGARGAALGAGLASLILLSGFLFTISNPISWLVISFLALGIMGFCTWEGSLLGVTRLNHKLDDYKDALARGQHLLVVDVDTEQQEKVARYAIDSHAPLKAVN